MMSVQEYRAFVEDKAAKNISKAKQDFIEDGSGDLLSLAG